MDVFDPSNHVTAEQFRQDKVDLKIGNWTITGEEAFVLDFPNLIATSNRQGDNTISDNDLGWIFNRPGQRFGGKVEMAIRSSRDDRAGAPPLFGGKLTLSPQGTSHTSLSSSSLILSLHTNPTRYLCYQELPHNYQERPPNWHNRPASLRAQHLGVREGLARRRSKERAFDGGDNFRG